MNIDFKTVTIGAHTGYGNASRLLIEALEGRSVFVQSGSSICLNFCMPPDYRYSDYTIGYTPWESTEVPKTWEAGLRGVDDLWTTSSWVADVFRRFRDDPIWVFPHGIESCWTPFKHNRENRPFTFLHVGEPAERKGGDILLQAWHKAFRNRKDVRLIYKCIKFPACRVKDKSGSIIASPGMIDNIDVITNIYSQEELLSLYNSSDCLVYPTRGEGFGLIPFEAMASGLPTILPSQGGTRDFAPMSPLRLNNSMWVTSTEEIIHPGLWMDHDVDELIYLMEYAIDNYEHISEQAYSSAQDIHMLYSWDLIALQIEDRLLSIQK